MGKYRQTILIDAGKWVAAALILRITVGVVKNYGDYFPPNFQSDFLFGRNRYFHGSYQWAFYAHILASPLALVLGLLLLSERFLARFPKWHRYLGRIQGMTVLFVVSPSGLWMSCYSATGVVAASGFATLAVLTAATTGLGWWTALKRNFVAHRRWMFRCYLLLCSAVVLRLTVGLAEMLSFEVLWIYPMSAWTSWLVPLLMFESVDWRATAIWFERQLSRIAKAMSPRLHQILDDLDRPKSGEQHHRLDSLNVAAQSQTHQGSLPWTEPHASGRVR